jgi:hypothetical protein
MELTWLDFGGQEVFYPTHQFFLTPQCVYLVVFRLDDARYIERVQRWLHLIAHFARDPKRPARVVVVATHAGLWRLCSNVRHCSHPLDVISSELERAIIWARLQPLIVANGLVSASVTVSCKTGQGFDQLEAAITSTIESGALGQKDVPKSYMEVWGKILEAKQQRQRRADFASFRTGLPRLSELTVKGALRFFTDAGLCFYNDELQLVVTDLQWLADLFKDVISFFSGIKDGVVTQEQLALTWKGSTADEIAQNMVLFEKFEMAFPKVQDGVWIVPSMLKERPFTLEPRGIEGASWH